MINFHVDSPVSMCDESSTINSGIMSGGIDASSYKNNNYGK